MVYVQDIACPECSLAFGWHVHLHINPVPAEVGRVRRAIRAALSSWSCFPHVVEDTVLLASELVGNAIKHGPQALVTVNLLELADRLLLEVTDASPALPKVHQPLPEDEQGRGMYLVQTVASAWGTRREPTGGKTTWCTITLHPGGGGASQPSR